MEKKTTTTNIILTEDLWVRAKFRATEDRMSLSELMRRALTVYLEESPMQGDRLISKEKTEELIEWVKRHTNDKPKKSARKKAKKGEKR